jgi:hypothetical protein
LRSGDVTTLHCDDARQLLVHLRGDGVAGALVAINRSDTAQQVELDWAAPKGWVDRLNGDAAVESHGGRTTLRLPPLWGVVLAN